MSPEISASPSTIESCKVSTPPDLAHAIVERLISGNESLADTGEWIDPCVGSGALVRTVHEFGISSDKIFGLDLDEHPNASEIPGRIEWGVDFVSWAQHATTHSFDCVIANPPFVQLSKLPPKLRESALSLTDPEGGELSKRANYWCSFLQAGLDLLNRGGSLAFILPASWDYADYAVPFRTSLQHKFGHFEVHRCHEPLFSTVDDGCVVIIGEEFGARSVDSHRYEYDSPEALVSSLSEKGRKSLSVEDVHFHSTTEDSFVELDEVMSVRLGGVTGDAQFFLLTESEREDLDLPEEACRPALTRSDHLGSGVIRKDYWNSLRSRGERVWLFRPSKEMISNNNAVQGYLQRSEEEGGCKKGYKVRSRSPWYRTPLPSPIHGFLSGMAEPGPWIALNRMPSLTATNTLYVVTFSEDIQDENRVSWAMALLTTTVRKQLNRLRRRYPQGLSKYEPGDVMDLRLPVPESSRVTLEDYQRVINLMLEGKNEYTQQADAAIRA
jgi:hypothetical protein